MALTKISQAAAYSGSAVAIGNIGPSTLGLIAADTIGRIALVGAAMRGDILAALRQLAPVQRATWSSIKRHAQFPLVSMPSAIINVLGSSFTAVMLVALFSATEAGNYAMVERALGAPIAMIAGAASQAYMAALSQHSRDEKRALFLRLVRSHSLIGLAPLIVLVLAAPWAVPFVFGPDWTSAGSYAQVLAPVLYLSFVTTPVNMTLVLCNRQRWQLAWDVTRLIVLALMWWVVGRGEYEATTAVAAYCSIATVFYVAHLGLSYIALRSAPADTNEAKAIP